MTITSNYSSRPLMNVPTIEDGDKFYIMLNNEITAVKISESYLSADDRKIVCKGRFTTPKEELGCGRIRVTTDGYLELDFLGHETPVRETFLKMYQTIEDARQNCPWHDTMNMANVPIADDVRAESIIYSDDYGGRFTITYWSYYAGQNIPIHNTCSSIFRDFVFKDGKLYPSKKNNIFPVRYWRSREECQRAINTRLAKINVCDFDEEAETPKTKEINITLVVRANASEAEIEAMVKRVMIDNAKN